MEIIHLEQGSDKWMHWRREGIGASESPVLLLEDHPWSTPYKLWELKTGKVDPDPTTYIQQKGQGVEPLARQWFSEEHYSIDPICAEHETYSYIRASFDGYAEGKPPVEIKYVGDKAFTQFVDKGQVDQKYVIQLQHQLFVSGMDSGYMCFSNGHDFHARLFSGDVGLQREILLATTRFWEQYIVKDQPPELRDSDEKLLDYEAQVYARECGELKEQIDELKARFNYKKELLIEKAEAANHPKCRAGTVRLRKIVSKKIDYPRIIRDNDIDVETYQTKTTEYWRTDFK